MVSRRRHNPGDLRLLDMDAQCVQSLDHFVKSQGPIGLQSCESTMQSRIVEIKTVTEQV